MTNGLSTGNVRMPSAIIGQKKRAGATKGHRVFGKCTDIPRGICLFAVIQTLPRSDVHLLRLVFPFCNWFD